MNRKVKRYAVRSGELDLDVASAYLVRPALVVLLAYLGLGMLHGPCGKHLSLCGRPYR